jgi:ComF family protein
MPFFSYLSFGLNLLLPVRCLVCEGQLDRQSSQVCPRCWERLPLIQHYCPDCGQPYSSFNRALSVFRHQCSACRRGVGFHFARARSIGLYQGVLKQLIHLLKYQQKSGLAVRLAGWMIQHMPPELDPAGFDYILPVPLHIKRLREREFNQSLLLAKAIAGYYQRPLMTHNLYRRRFRQPQAQLTGNLRKSNVKGVFGVRHPHRLEQKRLLLVDDVYTTGATVSECARTLLKAGAARVEVLTLARTEEKN